ncbi:MAG: ABC transporter ATP-binding protein [Lachnospiraceae bacterium]|nr:ABC transporter ATP-binding protein [Lachnospiraceae bacterium]
MKNNTTLQLLKLCNRANPRFIFTVAFKSVLEAGIILIWTYLPSRMVDSFIRKDIQSIVLMGIIMTLGTAVLRVLGEFLKNRIDLMNKEIKNHMDLQLDQKIMDIHFEMAETPAIMDLKEKAVWTFENYGGVAYFVEYIISAITSFCLVSGFYVILFSTANPIISAMEIIYGLTVIGAGVLWRKTGVFYWDRVSSLNRRFLYLTWEIAHNYKVGKDIRVYSAENMIGEQLDKMADSWDKEEKKYVYTRKHSEGVLLLLHIVLLGTSVFLLMKGRAPFSVCTLCVMLITQISDQLKLMVRNISDVMQMSSYGQYLLDFLNLDKGSDRSEKDSLLSCDADKAYTLTVDNVSFRYPGEEKYAISDISFEIKKGETVAFVGKNGSGKSTVVKLICRLYRPTSGRILFNGVDIEKYSVSDYRKILGVLFQDFQLFPATIRENVVLGREENETLLRFIYETYGIDGIISKTSLGDKTNLDVSFDENGVELSGGQKQDIAVGRCYYKKPAMVILDEPSSNLDAIAEEKLYNHILENNGKQGTIFVSHRLSGCKLCDRILVFDKGLIKETGSHNELMSLDGIYAALYREQMKLYA